MNQPLLAVTIQFEQDVVAARQRARQLAALLGFDAQDQTRIATAVSEIARNAFTYAGGGRVEFSLEGRAAPQLLVAAVADRGPGIADLPAILEGRYRSPTGLGLGIIGARSLMDAFDIRSTPGGTTVWLRKLLPAGVGFAGPEQIGKVSATLAAQRPADPLDEIRRQNQELMETLEALRSRQSELELLNRELADTNRGVVALYAELEERADHLRRVDEVKTRFLSNMTHEFRTPVNSILALTALLLDRTDGDLTPEQETQLGFIKKAAEDLSDLVNDLLDLAKVEAGKIIVRPAEFEAADLFGALRGMLRPLLVNPYVSLTFEEPSGLPPLLTDESKVSQVLRNFISNALKFTESGEVRVRAAYDEATDAALFSVSDTGIGIAPGDLGRVFEEFGQLESPIQRRVKGTGLGLPLSRRLAELLGGAITVESRLGAGSTFILSVPRCYKPVRHEQAEPAIVPTLRRGGLPILAVDDRTDDLVVYEGLLRGSAFQLFTTATVRQAREAMARTRMHAVLLDVVFAGQDTWKFLSELKSDPATARIPVIMATSVEDQAKAFALGADAYGTKPINRDWLLDQLNRLVCGRTALVIDDDEAFRYTMRQALRRAGWEAVEAQNGAEGLERASMAPYRAIFLDLAMPGLGGLEVLDRLRELPLHAETPTFIVSSSSLTREVEHRLELWRARFIAKGALASAGIAAALSEIDQTAPQPPAGAPQQENQP